MIKVKDICGEVLNTRFYGKKLRNALENEMSENEIVELDFDNIKSISQSFGDESFGKIAEEIGLNDFKRRFKIINVKDKIANVIKFVVIQRTKRKSEKKEVAAI